MKPIRIDFAPSSAARTLSRIRPLTWVVGCAALLLCAGAAVTAYGMIEQRDALASERQSLEQELARRSLSRPAPRKFTIEEARENAVNNAIAQLNLPWRDVLDAVEAATPATIALLALEPDARKHHVKGMAEAKSGEDMIAYIEQLKLQFFFSGVTLTRHETNEQDANRPIRFQFEAQWKEAAQ